MFIFTSWQYKLTIIGYPFGSSADSTEVTSIVQPPGAIHATCVSKTETTSFANSQPETYEKLNVKMGNK